MTSGLSRRGKIRRGGLVQAGGFTAGAAVVGVIGERILAAHSGFSFDSSFRDNLPAIIGEVTNNFAGLLGILGIKGMAELLLGKKIVLRTEK